MKKKGAAAARARTRLYEQREEEWWQKLGARTQLTWRRAQFVGGGKLITKPQDFYDAFDLLVTFPLANRGRGAIAHIQVTESPFSAPEGVDRGADRNAKHGEPPFPWVPPVEPVGAWANECAHEPEKSLGDFALVQVIVSYADARNPERRWWYQKEAVASCPAPTVHKSLESFA